MTTLQTDRTYMTLLRNAASARNARPGRQSALKTRRSALRDVVTEARRHLSSVDIHVDVHDERGRVFTARNGARSVDVVLSEGTDGLTVAVRHSSTPIPIRWNLKAFQWDGRRADQSMPHEPAWYTLAKSVVDELTPRMS